MVLKHMVNHSQEHLWTSLRHSCRVNTSYTTLSLSFNLSLLFLFLSVQHTLQYLFCFWHYSDLDKQGVSLQGPWGPIVNIWTHSLFLSVFFIVVFFIVALCFTTHTPGVKKNDPAHTNTHSERVGLCFCLASRESERYPPPLLPPSRPIYKSDFPSIAKFGKTGEWEKFSSCLKKAWRLRLDVRKVLRGR